MAIDTPTAGSPILDSWGAAVAAAVNKTIPLALTADQATNSATAVNITELTFPVVSGRVYVGRVFLGYTVNAANQGLQLGYSAPAGTNVAACRIWGAGGATTESAHRTFDGSLTGRTTTDATSNREAWIDFRHAATADGTFALQFARGGTSGAPGVTLRAGSGGTVHELS